jgi:UDP-N-acetylmuramate dehydrogenase
MHNIIEFDKLLNSLPGEVRNNFSLSNSCWFNVGGQARWLYRPKSSSDLGLLIKYTNDFKIPLLVIGVGSNILIKESGFFGVVVKLGKNFNYIKVDDGTVEVGCSTLDVNLSNWSLNNSYSGFEFLSGIPGTIGGAIAMNAGCYGSEIKNILHKVEIINNSGEIIILDNKDLNFSYRKHNLGYNPIFTRAWFLLNKGNEIEIQNKMNFISENKNITQPTKAKTGGSTFKNPDSIDKKAWQLIDECDLRGFSIGGARFSEKHCNFLINNGTATSNDIENLIKLAQEKVYKKFGIKLDLEIKIIGE